MKKRFSFLLALLLAVVFAAPVHAFAQAPSAAAEEFNAAVDTKLSNAGLPALLQAMPDGATAAVEIDRASKGILKKAVFDAVKGKNKRIVLYSNQYRWVINGRDVKQPTRNIDLTIKFAFEESAYNHKTKDAVRLIPISLAATGVLPCKAEIQIRADQLRAWCDAKGKLYFYEYNGLVLKDKTPMLTLPKYGTNGWASFQITKAKDYAACAAKVYEMWHDTILRPQSDIMLVSGETANLPCRTYNICYTGYKPLGVKPSYKSTNTQVATVTKNGKITAREPGTAKIKVKRASKTVTIQVTVVRPENAVAVESLQNIYSFSPEVYVTKGRSVQLLASVHPANATGAVLKWKCANTKIATIDSCGVLFPKKKGRTTVMCTAGNASLQYTVIVS